MKKKLVIISLILIILGVGYVYLNPGNDTNKETIVKDRKKTKKIDSLNNYDEISVFEGTQIGIFKDNIYKWQEGKLFLRSLSKEGESSNIPLKIKDPIIKPSQNYIFLANQEEGIIYYIDDKSQLVERVQMEAEIFNIKAINDNIIYHLKSQGNDILGIVNKKGQKLMKYDYSGETILDYSYDEKEEEFVLASLDLEENKLGTRLDTYYKLKDKETIYFDSELVLSINHFNLGNLLVLTDKNLYYISENEVVWVKELGMVKDFIIKDKEIYVLHGTKLSKFNSKGEDKLNLELNYDYKNISLVESGFLSEDFILYNDSQLSYYKNKEEFITEKSPIVKIDSYKDQIFVLNGEKYLFKKLGKKEVEEEKD